MKAFNIIAFMAIILSLVEADTKKEVESQAPAATTLADKKLRSSARLSEKAEAQPIKSSMPIASEKQVKLAGIGGAPEVADKGDGTKPLASFMIVVGAPLVLIPCMVWLKTGSLEKLM